MKKNFIWTASAITLLTGGMLVGQTQEHTRSRSEVDLNQKTDDSTVKPRPVTPDEKTRRLEERFTRLLSVDTVIKKGDRDSLGRCVISHTEERLKGRLIKGSNKLINKETCEYRSIRRVYGTDSAAMDSSASKRMASFEVGIRVDIFDDTYWLGEVSFFYNMYYTPYGCVANPADIEYTQFIDSPAPSLWDAYEIFIGGATSGCSIPYHRGGAWIEGYWCPSIGQAPAAGSLSLTLTPLPYGEATASFQMYDGDVCTIDYINSDYMIWNA